MPSPRRILVTGVLGCLGAWTAREALAEGDEIVGFDLGDDLARLRLVLGDDAGRVTLVRGASKASLSTTALPWTSAGASFHTGIASGKFQGVISPTTPSGRRTV